MILTECLLKFATTPGYCTLEEIKQVKEFLVNFNTQLILYKSVLGEPIGFSVESELKKVDWYVDYMHSKLTAR